MKRIEELSKFDMQCDHVPDGYGLTTVPALTRENMLKLMEKINELAEAHNMLLSRLGMMHSEEEE